MIQPYVVKLLIFLNTYNQFHTAHRVVARDPFVAMDQRYEKFHLNKIIPIVMGQFSKISDFIGMKFVRIPLKKYLRFSFEIFLEENEGLFKLYMLFNFYSLYT